MIDHIGSSPFNGHYVTHLKSDSGHWRLFDDERSKSCTFKQANNRNNYILLLRKKIMISESERSENLSNAESSDKTYLHEDELRKENSNPSEPDRIGTSQVSEPLPKN